MAEMSEALERFCVRYCLCNVED